MARLSTRLFSRTGKEPAAASEAEAGSEPTLSAPRAPPEPAGCTTSVAAAPVAAAAAPAPHAGAAARPPIAVAEVAPAHVAPRLGSERWGPVAGPAVENVLVLCHGMGSTAKGIIQIAPQRCTLLPKTLFVAPNGPEYAEAGGGRPWFDARDRFPVPTICPPQLGHTIDGAVIQAGERFLHRWLMAEEARRVKGRSLVDG